MELSGSVGPRRKVETPPAPFERSSEPRTSRAPEGRYPKATCGNDQCYPSRACRTRGYPSRVLFVAQLPTEESRLGPKRPKRNPHPVLSFSEEDKVRTTQPHDDALLITLRIGGYNVKRVIADEGNATEIMYPDLFKGLKLKPEDLMPYNSPLMSFDGKLVTPKGMIRLPIQTGPEIVEVNFIVVDTYSPYTAIVGRPWLHTLGVVASSLHQKVKFPSGDRVLEIRGCQPTARQCMVAAISHRSEMESSAPEDKVL